MAEPTIDERELIGRFGLYFEMANSQRVTGMLVGWLLICDPAQQSISELAEALEVSKASISTSIRGLQKRHLVERVDVSETRQHCYQIVGGRAWAEMTRARVEMLRVGRKIVESAVDVVGENESKKERVQECLDFLTFSEDMFGESILTRWDEYRAARIAERAELDSEAASG